MREKKQWLKGLGISEQNLKKFQAMVDEAMK